MLSTRATSSRYGGELRQVRLPVSDGSESFSGREGRDSALLSVNKIDERTKPTYRPTDRTPPRRRTSLRCRAGRTPRLAPLFGGTPPQLPRRLRRMGRETLARHPLRRRSGLPPSHGTDRRTGGVRLVGIACAAACTVLLVTGFFLRGKTGQQIPDIREFVQTAEAPVYTEKEVQLILSEQKTVRLEEKKSSIRYDAAEIHINEDARKPTTKKEVAAFNQLLVPYGKQTTLTLADGTRVWVNAGSRLIYPSAFDDDRREIYAEGEIYIEVAHDAARPFTVHTGKMDVRVLGTRFYVSSYGRDRTQEVVLRSGSVNVAPADAPEHGIHVPHPRGTRRRLHQLDSRILPLRQHAALRRTRTACPILQPDVRLLPRSRCHDHFGKARTQRRSLRGAADSLAHGTDPVPSIRGGIPALLGANIRRQPKPNAYGKSRAELKKAGQRPPTPPGTK